MQLVRWKGATFLRQGPQLQQEPMQPAPQEPRQQGHTQAPEALASSTFSPWRFLKHIWLYQPRQKPQEL